MHIHATSTPVLCTEWLHTRCAELLLASTSDPAGALTDRTERAALWAWYGRPPPPPSAPLPAAPPPAAPFFAAALRRVLRVPRAAAERAARSAARLQSLALACPDVGAWAAAVAAVPELSWCVGHMLPRCPYLMCRWVELSWCVGHMLPRCSCRTCLRVGSVRGAVDCGWQGATCLYVWYNGVGSTARNPHPACQHGRH